MQFSETTITGMYKTIAWAKSSANSEFRRIEIKRNKTGDDDVTFKLKYCGICHSDVHIANDELGNGKFSVRHP